jgi:hypothetical protein
VKGNAGSIYVDREAVGIICLSVLAIGTVIGIFRTKTAGWGKYSTSTLILTLALFIATILLVLGKVEGSSFANVLFAIVGYAGGLIGSKKAEE